MQIYFAASIAGGRDYLDTYTAMVKYLQGKGHHIPTEHIIYPDVLTFEKSSTAEEIYTRDIQWLSGSAGLIAEVSNPSLGVGYEICYALNRKMKVLCLYHDSVFLSRMITGNNDPNLIVKSYKDEADWKKMMDDFVSRLE